MTYAFAHLIVFCDVGAPAAQRLSDIGLTEGSSNTHPGQGAANRRFFFRNAFLELLWVGDPAEARSEPVRPTCLWQRWAGRRKTCPFGIVLRPTAGPAPPPYPTWAHHAPYLPLHLAIDIALDTPLDEPECFWLEFARAPDEGRTEPTDHGLPATEITQVRIGVPDAVPRSAAARWLQVMGILTFEVSGQWIMELTCDHGRSGGAADLRPHLPLVLRW